jgi:hypothetical protein
VLRTCLRGLAQALVACVALVVAGPALAAGQLEVVAQSSITIAGFTDSPDSFVGSVTLHATGGEVQFTFLPSDLAGPGSESVDRSHLSLIGATTIASGTFVIDTVKVAGLSDPGTYSGKVTLENGDQSLEVPVTVIANERPLLSLPAGGQLKLDVTRCGGGLSCWLAGWLIPDGGQDGSTSVLVTNSGKADDTISAAQIFATGSVGGHALAAPLKWSGVVPAQSTRALPMLVRRRQLPPDHYTGSAFVTVKDGSGLLTIPVDVSVRSGPLGAIVALLLGIVVGRLAVQMQSKGNQQTKLLWQLHALRAQVERRLSDPDDRACLADRLNKIATSIYAFQQLDGVPAALQQIGADVDTLARAHELDLQLQALPVQAADADALIKSIREAIRAGDYDAAKTDLASLEALLPTAPPPDAGLAAPGPSSVRTQGLRQNVRTLGAQLDQLSVAASRDADTVLTGTRLWLARGGHGARRLLYWLSGIGPEAAAEARLWIIRPMLAVILILLLVGLGLKTLYVGDASFGSNGFVDYFGLVLWGLSADVAARTLTTLGGNGTAAPAAPLA